jgi:hypothetical protein
VRKFQKASPRFTRRREIAFTAVPDTLGVPVGLNPTPEVGSAKIEHELHAMWAMIEGLQTRVCALAARVGNTPWLGATLDPCLRIEGNVNGERKTVPDLLAEILNRAQALFDSVARRIVSLEEGTACSTDEAVQPTPRLAECDASHPAGTQLSPERALRSLSYVAAQMIDGAIILERRLPGGLIGGQGDTGSLSVNDGHASATADLRKSYASYHHQKPPTLVLDTLDRIAIATPQGTGRGPASVIFAPPTPNSPSSDLSDSTAEPFDGESMVDSEMPDTTSDGEFATAATARTGADVHRDWDPFILTASSLPARAQYRLQRVRQRTSEARQPPNGHPFVPASLEFNSLQFVIAAVDPATVGADAGLPQFRGELAWI